MLRVPNANQRRIKNFSLPLPPRLALVLRMMEDVQPEIAEHLTTAADALPVCAD